MKKVLLATTVLALTAPMAVAEISFSGYGRFGLDYNSDADLVGEENSQINMRMRVNIDGSVETDSGVTFGGRVRLQYTDGNDQATLSPAQLYATMAGFRVEVGNTNSAWDSAALMYNSEIGYLDRGFGDPNYFGLAFESTPSGSDDRMGLFVGYSVGDLNARISLITLDQVTDASTDDEISISADYVFGAVTVAAAYADNYGAVDGDEFFYLGAEYAISDAANIGLLYFDFDANDPLLEDSTRVTLYGNYTMDAITFKGYVATDDEEGLATDVAYGLGVDYDLGGARLAADIHRSYDEATIAGLGVRFDF
jgi:outer membrane protein OmpU